MGYSSPIEMRKEEFRLVSLLNDGQACDNARLFLGRGSDALSQGTTLDLAEKLGFSLTH
jgi:hypothetical protein